MGYTNSSLVDCKVLSPNHSGKRKHSIDRISPHIVVGQLKAESIGNCFPKGRGASCNYGIGTEGRVCLIVEEKNRSWCTSSNANDQRAITIECASDTKHPYALNDKVYQKLIDLCTDICKRNGKTKLLWFANKTKSLNYKPKSNEMVITVHRWFANKSCPGDWLYSRLDDVAKKVTERLNSKQNKEEPKKETETKKSFKSYKVKTTVSSLNIRKGAGQKNKCVGVITSNEKLVKQKPTYYYPKDAEYTIVEEVMNGKTKWGKLKSGIGYISLQYTKKV